MYINHIKCQNSQYLLNQFFLRPTFFAKLTFFSPKLFFGILEKGNLSEQKKIGGKKINLAKKFFNLAKTILPFFC
jgi:hypothetical protein